jgi:hypothetical protein
MVSGYGSNKANRSKVAENSADNPAMRRSRFLVAYAFARRLFLFSIGHEDPPQDLPIRWALPESESDLYRVLGEDGVGRICGPRARGVGAFADGAKWRAIHAQDSIVMVSPQSRHHIGVTRCEPVIPLSAVRCLTWPAKAQLSWVRPWARERRIMSINAVAQFSFSSPS